MAFPQKTLAAEPKANGRTATTAPPKPAAPAAPPAEKVALRAYQIWQESGCPEGKQEEHWFRAERELRGAHGRPQKA